MTDYTKLTDFASKDTLPTGNAAKIVKGTEIDDEFEAIETAVATKANINSPTFTGTPAAPTAAASTDTTQVATTAHVKDVLQTGGYIATAGIADDAVTADKLADTTVTADTYGDATNVPQITVDAQGRLTNVTEVAVTPPSLSMTIVNEAILQNEIYDLPTDTFIVNGTAYVSWSANQGGRLDIEIYDAITAGGTLLDTITAFGGNESNGTDGGSGMSSRGTWSVLLPSSARSIKFVKGSGSRFPTTIIDGIMTFTGYHS